MDENDAYTIYTKEECENPIFKNVDATYILTLDKSNRINNIEEYIYKLSKKTFVQVNKGFRECRKKNVDTTCKDILHACKNIFYHARQFKNILVLEDDAVFIESKPESDLKCIDNFIGKREFNVYSLGSLGFTLPETLLHQRFIGFIGFAQAMIYSKCIREELLKVDIKEINHIDANFLSKKKLKFTYYKPLIVQYFENTENMNEWGISLKKNMLEKISTRLFITLIQKVLKLENSLYGWYIFYIINSTPFLSLLYLIYLTYS